MTDTPSTKFDFSGLGHIAGHHVSERLTAEIYSRVVRSGDHVLDIGANVGDHTAPLAGLVGPNGIVHAFEPNTDHHVTLMGIGANVQLWPCAVGDTVQLAHLHIPTDLHGWASLVDFSKEMPERPFRVQPTIQIPLDAIDGIEKDAVTFVKLDVERREFEALRGMVGFLRTARPVMVLENVHQQIEALFTSTDYSVFDLAGEPWRADRPGLANSLAVPNEIRASLSTYIPAPEQVTKTIQDAQLLPTG